MSLLSNVIKDEKQIAEKDINKIFSAYQYIEKPKRILKQSSLQKQPKDKTLPLREQISPEEIISNAKKQAEEMISNARSHSKEVNQKAYNEGYKLGYKDGLSSADGEIKERLNKISSLTQSILTEKKEILKNAESQIIDLSVELAKRILEADVSIDKSVIIKVAKKAISKVTEAERIKLRVNPADIKEVKDHFDEISSYGGGISHIGIISDPKVEKGGCLIDSEAGSVDAQISVQLEEYQKALKGES